MKERAGVSQSVLGILSLSFGGILRGGKHRGQCKQDSS